MTPLQGRVLNAIRELTVDGVSPSLREIVDHANSSLHPVHKAVEGLIALGRVRREGHHRGLRIVGDFDHRAIEQMPHAELLALKTIIDRRLGL